MSCIRVFLIATGIIAVTPNLSANITLVSRLSDAHAYAAIRTGIDNPPPQIQTDFLPANLSNSASVSGEAGAASADCTGNSSILLNNSMGTLLVMGDGIAQSFGLFIDAVGSTAAKLIGVSFSLTDHTYTYSLTGQLSANDPKGFTGGVATAKLTAGITTIFEVVANAPAVTLSETGTLPPGDYTLSIDISAIAHGFDPNGTGLSNSSANFNFELAPAATATPSPTPTPTPTLSPSATPTLTPTPTVGVTQALNLSTRMFVQTGDNVGIGGFIVTGNATKRVIVRAIGPSLAGSGVQDAMADPILELHGPEGFTTIINNDWRDTQEAEIIATGLAPTNNLESAIVADLAPGNYTAIVAGNNNTSGVALVEVYDLDLGSMSKLGNISTRASVSTGDDIVIAGFILGNGTQSDQVIIRGIGPSLGAVGVPDVLADPTLELRNSNGTLLASNNNWQDNVAQAEIISFAGLAPTDPLEAAIARTLPPGQYTALLAGSNNGTGVGLVEVYDNGIPLIVTALADSGPGSLRNAIAEASDGNMIQFDSTFNGQTILLTSGEILIDKNVVISGPGPDMLAVSRDSNAADFRILRVTPNHTVIIDGIRISGGKETGLGGGIFDDGATLTISNCTISGNSLYNGWGGGIYGSGGILVIVDTTVSNNSTGFTFPNSGGWGGGIYSSGTLTIIRSTIANNAVYSGGGGIHTDGPLIMTDSTISGNFAAQAGGISAWNGTTVTITHCTISGNNAGNNVGGGIFITGPASLGNTILDSGSGENIFNSGGTVVSTGYNLSSDDAGGFLTGPGDQINTDPILGPLQNNGGATFTCALLKGSPAIDAGDPNFTAPPFTDQRGYLRVYNDRIDIGSFEVQPTPSPTPTPTLTPSPTPTSTPSPSSTAIPTASEPPQIDIGVEKFDSPDPIQLGQNLAYTIIVHNYGPNIAEYTRMYDSLPANVNFVSVTTTQGSCDHSVSCDLGSLAPGAEATVTLVVTPTVAGTVNNTANAEASGFDLYPPNNHFTASTTVLPLATPSPRPVAPD